MDPRIVNEAEEALLWTNWRLQLTIPSILATDETFALRITAFGPDGLPSAELGREIIFEPSPGIEGLPKSVRLSPTDGGHITVDGLRAVGPEDASVVVRPEGCPSTLSSNPAWVFDEPPYRIYWGDLHVHTTYSDCSAWACKDPEFCYAYARDATHLDFAAAADHLRGIAADEAHWPRLQELVRLYDAPGSFVPFLAFESSHKTGFGGDINAYFLNPDAPYFCLDRQDMWGKGPAVTLSQLWDYLDSTEENYFTVPHHTGRAGKYRSFADPVYDAEREPLFEIYSAWGSSESRCTQFPLSGGNSDELSYFQDTLKAGCRYGVIASSDDHTTLPGGESKNWSVPAGPKRVTGYIHKGLAAVSAEELSRESLWQGLTSRRCYGTTFARSLLDVRIGDLAMGQEATVSRRDRLWEKRNVRVKALTADMRRLEVILLRNGEEIARQRWNGERPEVAFEDTAQLDRIALRDAPFHPDPFVVYYVRVEDGRHETQWSSPIWLDLIL